MAFQLVQDSPNVRDEVLRREFGVLLSRLVGFDDIEDRHYSVFVTLDVMPGGDHELSFFLEEYDSTTSGESQYWRASDVARFIPTKERKVILAVVLHLATEAVRLLEPKRIYMCSHGDDPDERAVRKYNLICPCHRDVRLSGAYAGSLPRATDLVDGPKSDTMNRGPPPGRCAVRPEFRKSGGCHGS